jgi:hypothetical protein
MRESRPFRPSRRHSATAVASAVPARLLRGVDSVEAKGSLLLSHARPLESAAATQRGQVSRRAELRRRFWLADCRA